MTDDSKQSVTWLLPVKNGMPYLRETLRSVSEQSYANASIIAWDNGSSDGTVDELSKWIPSKIPGKIISDTPLSLGESLASMVEIAETEYCARIDADDVNLPDRLAKQVAILDKDPSIGLCGTNVSHIDENGIVLNNAHTYPSSDEEVRWRLRFATAIVHPTVLFRRSAILKAGNYRNIIPGQDLDLWLRLSLHCKMVNLEERLVRCRKHPARVGATYKKGGVELHRELIELYAEKLFPGSSRENVLRLHDILVLDMTADVSREDIALLQELAKGLGEELEQQPSYFLTNDLFKQQMNSLRKRCLSNIPGVRTLRNLKRKLTATS